MTRLPDVDLATLKAKVPLYVELYGQLRRFIEDAQDLAMLPPERTLASAYGVSRITVRKALQELKSDGLVSSRQGRGYMVIRPNTGPQRTGSV
ncbi:MAG: GntR family transcriptional regulator [Asticcacaulis sp.]